MRGDAEGLRYNNNGKHVEYMAFVHFLTGAIHKHKKNGSNGIDTPLLRMTVVDAGGSGAEGGG